MPYRDPDVRRAKHAEAARRRRKADRTERNSGRRQALLERDRPSEIERAFAAGWFEGEGTATIVQSGRRGYSRCIVSLASTDREIVDWLAARWGGAISERQPSNPRHNVSWTWRLNGDDALPFLLDVQPLLILLRKREVVALVVECQMARWDGQRSVGYAERINAYRERVRHLNRRGR